MSRNPYTLAKRLARLSARAISDSPASPGVPQLLAHGLEHHRAGRLGEAERVYRRILELDAQHADSLHLLGMVAFQTGNCDVAAELISRAILRNGRDAIYFTNLGNILQTQGKLDQAVDCYQRALQLNPTSASAHSNLGQALQFLGRLEDAARSFEEALKLDSEIAVAHTNLGNVRQAQGRLEEAVACYERALAVEPANPEAYSNLGGVLDLQGKLTESTAAYDRALQLKPDFAVALFNRSLLRLRKGNFVLGLPDYERRWHLNKRRDFTQPQWYGQSLESARILLYPEQGLGDTVQFLRYVPLVQAAGGQVILEVQPQMRRLAARLPGVTDLICSGEALPPFDWHCPLMSLPLAFSTTLDTIPATVPYLIIPQEADTGCLPDRGNKLRVGFAWAGSSGHLRDRFRSIPLELLKPVFELAGAQFYSLQMGSAAEELSKAGISLKVINLAPRIEDMADTAALIAHLDLVIAVDTAVAHLAGALGKPVWVMLPLVPDWRWLLDREDSPWYPTMRLFRQAKLGAWASVVEAVRSALQDKIATSLPSRS